MSESTELRTFLEFAVELCEQAGRITLQYFQTDIVIETKTDQSPVTVADRRTEERIREAISRYYPQHAIVGEEFGESGNSEYVWYIDPIDGTRAFVQGVPIYGVMLGLAIRGRHSVGVVNLPALNEMIYAATGEGCYWNFRRTKVTGTTRLSDALFLHSGREFFVQQNRLPAYRQLEEKSGWQRTWGDCYGHILVATGRADFCVDPILHPWDAAPLIPIVQEAGGLFVDWSGKVSAESNEGISSNPLLLPEILKIVG